MGLIKLPETSIQFFKDNVDEIFQSGAFAEGKWNKAIAQCVEQLTGAEKAVATSSNGTGVVALLQLYRHYFGRSKCLLQSNTMYGVKIMPISAGLDVVGYADCSTATLMPTLEQAEVAIAGLEKPDETVFLLTHIGGVVNPDIEAIAALCREKNVILLEDCAHSYSATLYGKHTGLFGNAGVYSFYATKALPAGEGGCIVTNDKALGEMLSKYVIYDRFDQQQEIGNNIRPSEMQALLTYAALKEVDEILDNKRAIAAQYMAVCDKYDIPYFHQDSDGQKGNYYKFLVLSKSGDVNQDYPNLKTKTSPVYDYALGNSVQVNTSHVCLPIWYGQPQEVTDKAIAELISHYE